jgi:hypothetical protein
MYESERIGYTETHNFMERNQACVLFIHVLNKDIISIVRSYLKIPVRFPLPKKVTWGCDLQVSCVEEWAYEDIEIHTLVLRRSKRSYPMRSDAAKKFLHDIQYGCGTCDACKKTNG